MTLELQHAKAQYEEARIRYRQAVRGSLAGASNGDAIREAIQAFQVARVELARLSTGPAPVPVAPESPSRWARVRRLLHAV